MRTEKFSELKRKIRFVWVPFVIVMISTVSLMAAARYFMDIKFHLVSWTQELWELYLPMAFPLMPLLLFLNHRIASFEWKGKSQNWDWAMVYFMLMWGAIGVPCAISQHYLTSGPYELIEVRGVENVRDQPHERFFDVDRFDLDIEENIPFFYQNTTGRNGTTLNFHLFLGIPFQGVENAWYMLEFRRTLKTRDSDEKKNKLYSELFEEANETLKGTSLYDVVLFKLLRNTEANDHLRFALKESKRESLAETALLLEPSKKSLDEIKGSGDYWTYVSLGVGALLMLLLTSIPRLGKEKSPPAIGPELGLLFLNPDSELRMTILLITINTGVFIYFTFAGVNPFVPQAIQLEEIGGRMPERIEQGEYWRLLSAIFLHAGIGHLVMNMFGLLIGSMLGSTEKVLRALPFLTIYLVSGLLAGYVGMLWHPNSVGIGASGAVYGVYGMALALFSFNMVSKTMFGIVAGIAVLGLLFGLIGNVDNAAHIGGLVSGFILTSLFIFFKGREKLRDRAGHY